MSVVSDNFNRANETPLAAPWADAIAGLFTAGVRLVSNTASGTAAINLSSVYNSGTWGKDQVCEGTVGGTPGGFMGVCVRWDTTATGYCLETDGSAALTELVRYNNGAQTILVTALGTVANGDVLRITISGPNIQCFKNGVFLTSATDSTITTGSPGIVCTGSGTLDNFFASEIGVTQYPRATARGIRTGRGGLILRRLRVPLQNWPSAPAVAADDGVYSFEDGDWLSAIDDAGDVDTSSWAWYQDDSVISRDDNNLALGVILPDSFEWDEPDLRDDAVYLWPLSHAPPIDDDLPQQSIVSDSYEQPAWPEDELFGFDFWTTPGNDLPQQSIVEDSSNQLPWPEDGEDYGIVDWQDPGDDLPQQSIVQDGQPVDVEDEPFAFDLSLPEEPAVVVDQIPGEDSSDQLEDTDEDYGFSLDPLSDDDLPQQGITEDGSYQDPEDEPFGFEFPVAIDNIAADQIQPEDATQQPVDPEDEPFGFANTDPLPADVESNQVFVEDGNTREEDIGEEDFGFTFDQAVPEQVIQSNQVFVEDASDQLPEPEGDEPFDFSIDPTPDDVIEPPVVFPTFNISGGGRRWYIIKKKRFFFTNEELTYYIARHMVDLTREDIRVTYKTKPDRVVSNNAYQALLQTVKALEKMAPDVRPLRDIESDDDDDEAIIWLI